MRLRTTIRLLAAVCVMGAVVYMCERLGGRDGSAEGAGAPLIDLSFATVESLEIRRGDMQVKCRKIGGEWRIEEPLDVRADSAGIQAILEVAGAIKRREIVSAAERAQRELTLEDYGLAEPRAVLALETGTGRKELLAGADSPLGRQLYVKLSDEDAVIAVSSRIIDVLPGSVQELRDKYLLHGSADRTWRLGIQTRKGGFIELARGQKSKYWLFQQPDIGRADQGRVLGILEALYSAQVREFVWDEDRPQEGEEETGEDVPPDAGSRFELYHLADDEARVKVMLWRSGEDVGVELLFGRKDTGTENKVYARRKGVNSVYAVDPSVLEVLDVEVKDLRNRNVFTIAPADVMSVSVREKNRELLMVRSHGLPWRITEPVDWPADRGTVDQMLRDLTRLRILSFADGSETNLAVMGLTPVSCEMRISTGTVEGGAEAAGKETDGQGPLTEGVAIGRRINGRSVVYGKFTDRGIQFGDEATVFTLSAEETARLGETGADPLVYRDKTMLALSAENIRRITLIKCGKEETITRDDSGDWKSPEGAGPVDTEAVESILFAVSNLRASKFEAYAPENRAPYGLAEPHLTLTLGLSGSEGIQKSVMIGFRSPGEGIYAMVKGADVIFVLRKAAVDMLTRDLIRASGE
ncbi:MAG: DUF4340 domain-containing protein [Kiritimatiellia bacterium]